ncbi:MULTISPECIES: hypothetical protein [Pseudomonas]|uniref:hypothetical protein n=1 Tax=Pseudomonas TaxID=286 RepID=UPI001BE7BF92|nr:MULTISPECIES: hypothetical protein [Pseudomonas]MBT2339538.1 hypothetical protein [Pseudomonas fluorescens]MCD4528702.1 hypothetical protein [Pseudomonas sp. C3-2018]
MDWKQFIAAAVSSVASVVSSLAWPVVAFLIATMFKKPITDLIRNLRSFKYGKYLWTFSEQIEAIKEDVMIEAQEGREKLLPPSPSPINTQQAYENPLELIIKSFNEVEKSINAVANKYGIDTKTEFETHRMIMTVLLEKKLVNELTFTTYTKLADLRRESAMGQNVSHEAALQMSIMCQWLVEKLSAV